MVRSVVRRSQTDLGSVRAYFAPQLAEEPGQLVSVSVMLLLAFVVVMVVLLPLVVAMAAALAVSAAVRAHQSVSALLGTGIKDVPMLRVGGSSEVFLPLRLDQEGDVAVLFRTGDVRFGRVPAA